jgi:hypothetical protein
MCNYINYTCVFVNENSNGCDIRIGILLFLQSLCFRRHTLLFSSLFIMNYHSPF